MIFKAFDEIQINTGCNIVRKITDKTRYLARIKFMSVENSGFESVNFYCLRQRNSGTDYYIRHIKRFNIHHTI